MKAIRTKTTNGKFVGEGYCDLPVTIHEIEGKQCAEACFELTEEEIKQIIKSRKVYYTFFGANFPPMMLHTESYIIEAQNDKVESK